MTIKPLIVTSPIHMAHMSQIHAICMSYIECLHHMRSLNINSCVMTISLTSVGNCRNLNLYLKGHEKHLENIQENSSDHDSVLANSHDTVLFTWTMAVQKQAHSHTAHMLMFSESLSLTLSPNKHDHEQLLAHTTLPVYITASRAIWKLWWAALTQASDIKSYIEQLS